MSSTPGAYVYEASPLFAKLYDAEMRPRLAVILILTAAFILYGAAIFLAAYIDGVLWLSPPGRGLLDHYGFMSSVITTYLVALNCYFVLSYFIRTITISEEFIAASTERSAVESILRPHIRSLQLRTKWRGVLLGFILIGIMSAISIFKQLDSPEKFWGNDVFNARAYTYSYYVANSFLAAMWSIVYPVALFYIIHITASMEIIISRLQIKGLIKFDFFHRDNCCGLSRFGNVNFMIMLMYVWPFATMYALSHTHSKTYLSLIAAGIGLTVIFIAQSVYGVYAITKSINKARERELVPVNAIINKMVSGALEGPGILAIAYRERILSVSSIPYSQNISYAVNVLRLLPAIVTAGKYAMPAP